MDVHSGQVLADIDRVVDPNLEIHVVLDNGSSHRSKHTTKWFEAHPRWVVHFTPPHASWVNQVELFFSILQRKVIRGGRFSSRDDLITKLLTFIADYDQTARPPDRSSGPTSPTRSKQHQLHERYFRATALGTRPLSVPTTCMV